MSLTDAKITAGTALLGAGIGAVGAILLDPLILGIAALIALLATGRKIHEHDAHKSKAASANQRVAV